ncbi:hypothetical protein AC249_AIPGENE3746 [Exaiptasia diaphana]|nr:hypothetical protein AC249_AIPGENE3746 [Exaiptasia diaphana]
MVKGCPACQHNQPMNIKEPPMPHDIPSKPWHTLGSDLFFWNGSPYLLISDYFSKFPIVRKLNNIQSSTLSANTLKLVKRGSTSEENTLKNTTIHLYLQVAGFTMITT